MSRNKLIVNRNDSHLCSFKIYIQTLELNSKTKLPNKYFAFYNKQSHKRSKYLYVLK